MRILKKVIITFLIISIGLILGQSQNPLDEYIRMALTNHGSIKEQNAWLEEKKAGLVLAKKNWSPEINFGTSYTLALGGRNISFPIGDLLNPAHRALNDLTNTNNFPMLENQTVQFLPHNFYDSRVRITKPLIQPEIKINQQVKQSEIDVQFIQKTIAERDVIKEVKKAYYQLLQATEYINILNQSLVLLQESERVSKSLIKNGVALPSSILRIESEKSKINAQKFSAENQIKEASSYLNFLIGRQSDQEVVRRSETTLPDVQAYGNSIKNEEIELLDKNMQMQQLAINLEKKYNAPRLGAQLDLGSQNFNFKWGGYALGGVQLEIPLWNNKKSDQKQIELQAGRNALNEKKQWAETGIALQIESAKRSLETAINSFHSFTPLIDMSRKYHDELLKRYKEGQANPIEIVDAVSQITFAEIQQSIARYQAWTQAVELERLLKK